MPGHGGAGSHQREPALGAQALARALLALWGTVMGAFSGACLLAMAGAFADSQIYGNFEGVLRRGGHHGGTAVAGPTGLAIMMVVCFAFVAFSG